MFGFRCVTRFKSRVIVTTSLIFVSVVSLWYFRDFSEGLVNNTVKGSAIRSVSSDIASSKQGYDNDSCEPYKVPSELIRPQTPTNLSGWRFEKRVPCPNIRIDGNPWTSRRKVALVCNGSSARLRITRTQSSADIDTRSFRDACLSKYIYDCCTDGKNVPNVVHYVWFNNQPVRLVSLVSLLSVVRFMRPCLILFHGNQLPFGRHWDYFVNIFPYVVHVERGLPSHVYGQRLDNPVHAGDVIRLQALLHFGGVYLDWDQVLLRPIDELRDHVVTMSLETPKGIANGLILSAKNARFLQLWLEGYKNYRHNWNWNSIKYPFIVAKKHPELIHVENYTFFRPLFSKKQGLLYEANFNWTASYAMHFYNIRIRYGRFSTLQSIRTANTTIGSVWRHIVYGNKELCID